MSLVLHSAEDGNFYTLSFTVGHVDTGRCIMIGGLQGPRSSEENNAKSKTDSKTVRSATKSLMVSLLTLIAQVWEVNTILAVKTQSHTYAARRYSKGRIKTDYDALWQELGGIEYNRHFYALKVNDTRRDTEECLAPNARCTAVVMSG